MSVPHAARQPRRPPVGTGRQLGLFDNTVGEFGLEELVEAVRELEREHPGQPVADISAAVFDRLAMKRTRRAAELVTEAIRLARQQAPRPQIAGSAHHAGTAEVRDWAARAGFDIGADAPIPGPVVHAYNQAHPDRPY